MSSIELRAYQVDAIQQMRDRIAAGRRAPLCVSPTGSGKTVMEAAIIKMHLDISPQHRVLVVAHRRELIGQIARTLVRMNITDLGEIVPGTIARPQARVQVASIQTLLARDHFPPGITLIVFDECHHYSADSWHDITKVYPGVIRVGFTATPMRSDGRGMSPAFDSIVVVSTIKELTALGYLVPCKVIAPVKPLAKPRMTHAPVDAYLAHANGGRTVVFADFIVNAEKFVAEFLAKGVRAVAIHGNLSDDERKRALQAHKEGAVLVNCMVLTEGWDSPETSVCILARGCGNVGTYLQIVGRVLRPSPGKKVATLIDLTGRSFYDHGAPDEDRQYSLTGKGIRGKTEDGTATYCPVCGQPVEPAPNSWPCPVCEYTQPGQVVEPRYTGDELAERYAVKRTEDNEKRIETLARWITEARSRIKTGNHLWAAVAKYKAVYGNNPPAEVRITAEKLSKTMACVMCTGCGIATSKTYQGGKCGKCAFGKVKTS